MSDTQRKQTITLTDRPPVRILEDEWPVIARATWYDGEVESQANRKASIRVREHEDGRRIVYGMYSTAWQGAHGAAAGYLITTDRGDSDTATVEAVKMVRDVICGNGHASPDIADWCIAQLPADEL